MNNEKILQASCAYTLSACASDEAMLMRVNDKIKQACFSGTYAVTLKLTERVIVQLRSAGYDVEILNWDDGLTRAYCRISWLNAKPNKAK